MVINNAKIVTIDKVIEGFFRIENGKIVEIGNKPYKGDDHNIIDACGKIVMPGFIDIHFHGSCGIDFMDAKAEEYKIIADALYKEGITNFLATTLTSDYDSLKFVCENVNKVKNEIPSLAGIHFEGPYISAKHKGAQNEAYIREPNIEEFDKLQKISGNNIRYISLAPEASGAMEFIKHVTKNGVTVSAGHTDATFADIETAIKNGLSNITHTHNAMSKYDSRNPGVVAAAMYFDNLYTEVICDTIHVCPNTLKTFYKIVGPDRFVMITDALKIKHSDVNHFQLFGLDCERKNGAAYLLTGPLAGSLLTMEQGLKNVKEITDASLIDLAKISSTNAAKSIHLSNVGEIKVGYHADFVILDNNLNLCATYKNGIEVFKK